MADAVAVMCALLLAHAPVTSIVGEQVFAGDVPVDETLPAIGIREISRIEQDTVARNGSATVVTARIQVTVYTGNYPDQKALLQAARLGPGTYTGTVAGVQVLSVLRDAVGPDMQSMNPEIFQQSRDFKVTYLEPN